MLVGPGRDGKYDYRILSDYAFRTAHQFSPITPTKSKCDVAQQPSIIGWKWYIRTELKNGQRIQASFINMLSCSLGPPTTSILLFTHSCTGLHRRADKVEDVQDGSVH